MYEFWANHPQSLHQMTILMSDRGIPASYRHMNGYSSHTLSFWNSRGERVWVKWHLKTNQGIKTFTAEEAAQQPAFGAQQDLVDAIDRGEYPSWSVKVQIMTETQARTCRWNPFDLTEIWPHKDFPLIDIGQLELNRNVINYFAETEQAAFAPSNLVPGIGASPDKMLQGRLLAYQDAHRYRVGVNVNQIPVNAPRCPVNHYQRDGANFYPNDRINQGAPAPTPRVSAPPMPVEADASIGSHSQAAEDYHTQAGDLYRMMNAHQKQQLAANIAGGLKAASPSVQTRMLAQLTKADPEYAEKVRNAMNMK